MRVPFSAKSIHLGYCSNVSAADSLEDIHRFLLDLAKPLKQRLSPDEEFGLGMYLPASVLKELSENEYRRWDFDRWIQENHFYVFSLNAFPFGNFQNERVKEKVFEPDWSAPARLEQTKQAADLLSRWLPEGVNGSISTHTGAYGARVASDPIWKTLAENFTRAALHLHRLEEKTGRRIVLSLEPEPFAIVDTTKDFVSFYQECLLRFGVSFLQARWDMKTEQAEALLRRHLGVCFDTCHLCVQWEDLGESLQSYRKAGIPIGKAQISAALELREPGKNLSAIERLKRFAEPRYFHQTIFSNGKRFADLDQALSSSEVRGSANLRSHFHVPIFWEGDHELSSTRAELARVLPEIANSTEHLEIETYTWEVIPQEERKRLATTLLDSMEKEYRWLLAGLEGARVNPSKGA